VVRGLTFTQGVTFLRLPWILKALLVGSPDFLSRSALTASSPLRPSILILSRRLLALSALIKACSSEIRLFLVQLE
jgi:hypothetical protein